jgi:hypothetical protein
MFLLAISAIFGLAVLFSTLGLGGAILYAPLLNGLGFDFKTVAIPTALALNGLTTGSAALAYARAGLVDWRGGLPMAITALIAAPLGAQGARYLPAEDLMLLFAVGMVLAGARMVSTAGRAEPTALVPPRRRIALTAAGGLAVGAIAGLLGIGGGFLVLPLLVAVGYPTRRAIATGAFVITFASFSGFLGHAAIGHVDWPLLFGAGVAVILGSQLGAHLMRHRLETRWLKRGFGLLLIGVALKFGASAWIR